MTYVLKLSFQVIIKGFFGFPFSPFLYDGCVPEIKKALMIGYTLLGKVSKNSDFVLLYSKLKIYTNNLYFLWNYKK